MSPFGSRTPSRQHSYNAHGLGGQGQGQDLSPPPPPPLVRASSLTTGGAFNGSHPPMLGSLGGSGSGSGMGLESGSSAMALRLERARAVHFAEKNRALLNGMLR